MATAVQKMTDFTIRIPQMDIKRFKGLAKAMGWAYEKNKNYYESDQFYQDIDQAEAAIEKGEGQKVCNLEELDALFL